MQFSEITNRQKNGTASKKSRNDETPKEAFKWSKRAAAQGAPDAILMLGWFYEDGIGTAKNTQKAIFYYSKAAEMEVEGAQEALDTLKASTHQEEKTLQNEE